MNVRFDMSDFKRFGVKLSRLRKIISEENIPVKLASDARVMIQRRLIKGEDVNGASFPGYSTKPYYRSRRERPIGGGGRRKTKSGRPARTIIYDGGYREFAASTKRTGSTVTLHASGKMQQSMQAVKTGPDSAKVIFTRATEARKAKILQDKKGPFMGLNPGEQKQLEITGSEIVRKAIGRSGL